MTSMEERIREALWDHKVWWYGVENIAHCKSCGYLGVGLETWEHQAAVVAGIVQEAQAESWRRGYRDCNRDPFSLNPYRGEGATK